MKFREDFVTNSSSSSFILTLNIELKNKMRVSLNAEEAHGDYEGFSNSFQVWDENNDPVTSLQYDPGSVLEMAGEWDEDGTFFEEHDPDEVAGRAMEKLGLGIRDVRLTDLLHQNAAGLAEAFGFHEVEQDEDASEEDFDEEEWDEDPDSEEWDEEAGEGGIVQRLVAKSIEDYGETSQECIQFLQDHVTSEDDIADMTLTLEFGGRGEDLSGPEEILRKVLGWNTGMEVFRLLSQREGTGEQAYEEMAQQIGNVEGMSAYSHEALVQIARFAKETDYTPDQAIVRESLADDGKIDITFEVN